MKVYRKLILLAVLVAVLAGVMVTPAAAQGATCEKWHIVQRGDTLFKISKRYGMSMTQLMQVNNVITNPNVIYVGQSLCVAIRVNNPPPTGTAYVVQSGDTLNKIARAFGVNVVALARHNNLVNMNLIYAGQTLMIPDVTIQPL